jgi:hypothetical protein
MRVVLRFISERLGTSGKRRLAVLVLYSLYVRIPFFALSLAVDEFRDATVGFHTDLQRLIKAARRWVPTPDTDGTTASTSDGAE